MCGLSVTCVVINNRRCPSSYLLLSPSRKLEDHCAGAEDVDDDFVARAKACPLQQEMLLNLTPPAVVLETDMDKVAATLNGFEWFENVVDTVFSEDRPVALRSCRRFRN